MSTQNVNVARFARNVEWDFFCDFQTLSHLDLSCFVRKYRRSQNTIFFFFQTLRKFGASGVHFLATHGIFSGSSIETILLNADFIRKIVVTNTVPQVANRAKMPDILQVIDISGKYSKNQLHFRNYFRSKIFASEASYIFQFVCIWFSFNFDIICFCCFLTFLFIF